MAISKLIFNGVIQMDVTGTTADENSVLSGYGAVGSDGQWFDGIASGGGGGLEYESGTYTPVADESDAVISFSNTHTTTPLFILLSDTTGTYDSTYNSNYNWEFYDWEKLGNPLYASSSSLQYAMKLYRYRASNDTVLGSSQSLFTSKPYIGVSATGFTANSNSTSRYWRAGRTYKWIAVWAPT